MPEVPKPPQIVIHPARATLKAGDPGLQLVVEGPGEHGGRRDLTSMARKVEPAGIVEVSADGYVKPLKPGVARIKLGDDVYSEIEVDADNRRAWDFAEDIEPILTRTGCNTGGCHGRGDGQNGFHLSLFGYDPESDFRSMTRDLGERRLSTFRPESSLLLAKATGTIPHVGGPRMTVGSPEYETLLAWLKAGVPYASEKNHGRIAKLTVEPGDVRLGEPGPQQLRVVARYADGHERDVTRLASYRTNDDSVVTVDARGQARLLRRAEADLVVRYESQVVSTRLATIINPDLKFDFAKRPRKNFIDDELFKRLESLNVPPSPSTGDAAFLRRVSLDLTGEQPTPDRVREFLKDVDPDKRAKLVDSLIKSTEFILFWDIKLGDMLEITTGRPDLGNSAIIYQTWLKKQIIANTPWDQVVRTLLTAVGRPDDRETGGPVSYALEGLDPKVSAEKTAQRFLGLRIRCAQCHDHPFDLWTQDDYFGLAATFAKVQRAGGMGPGMMNKARRPDRADRDARTPPDQEARRGQDPRRPDDQSGRLRGSPGQAGRVDDRRRQPLLRPGDGQLDLGPVLRQGIADPPDDLSRANPPVHPELLDALAKHFVAHKYDVRDLIRTIATSEAYAMASSTAPGNEADNRLFSHQMPRPSPPTRWPTPWRRRPRSPTRSPAGTSTGTSGPSRSRTRRPAARSSRRSGRCNRINGCASVANPALSLRQSLLVIGGSVIEQKVSAPRGYLSNLLEVTTEPESIVENLYLRSLCRPPTSEELSHWTADLSRAPSLREAAEDLFWALLNSREFAFNH